MSEPLLLGVDAGLTNVKAVAFDRSGTAVAGSSTDTPGRSPAPGRDEQDHDDLWAAAVDVIDSVLAEGAVDSEAVAGVGLSGHGHGLYALDEAGDPVCGVKSTDDRGAAVLDAWAADGRLDEAADLLGWRPFGADPYCLLGWFDRERPAVAERIDTVLFCKDVLANRLTGARSTDAMDGSALVPPDGDTEAVLDALDLDEYAGAVPDVIDSTDACGTVTADATAETGLPEGVPVAAGLHDVGACALGAGVTGPGEATVILGTWGQSVVVTDGPDAGSGGLPRRYLDGWLRYRGTRAGAACLDWFVDEFGDEWRAEADERGVDPYEVYEERAASVPAGAEGVLFHPYLNGSTDHPEARGGFYGLDLDASRDRMLRAVYDGVATALALGVEDFDVAVDDLRVSGGGAQSHLWTRTFADLLDDTVRVPDGTEMGARGAAVCGGVAAGVYADVDGAVAETVGIQRRHDPDSERAERYRTVAAAFEEARDAMGPAWGTLMRLSGQRGGRE
ncbi:carbohydrate kinase [Halosimplex litoreum]|uniref:Carbohydrate kinase n=1 Tax=Halosimplex litoreum TaxID=1198301 RepID=A0A7T3FYZ0_9EURY|nr:FGGY-family carbohydrate kinase [Halosimplex litoreum]QPV63280.1 carbohydrate kinase [Halosimplex litoreum]